MFIEYSPSTLACCLGTTPRIMDYEMTKLLEQIEMHQMVMFVTCLCELGFESRLGCRIPKQYFLFRFTYCLRFT